MSKSRISDYQFTEDARRLLLTASSFVEVLKLIELRTHYYQSLHNDYGNKPEDIKLIKEGINQVNEKIQEILLIRKEE